MNKFLLGLLALLLSIPQDDATAMQATTVFKGIPTIKISEGGTERLAEALPRDKAVNLECVISKIGDNYYWASRDNKRMVRTEAGYFITFLALDGAGYVKAIAPGMKKAVSVMGDTESKFDYVEHLLIGLKSVTYYGTAR